MSDDVEYLANYRPDTLYIHPARNSKGTYASLLDENEILIGEIEVTERSRLAVSAFYVNEKSDFNTFKLTKLKFHKTYGWRPDGEIQINYFQIAKLKEFVSLLSSLDLKDAKKARISLGNAHIETLETILKTDQGSELLKQIAQTPQLSQDVFALAHKKAELEVFRRLLYEFDSYKGVYVSEHSFTKTGEEDIWQHFFEHNQWIFGHGLNYQFLHKVGKKLEATTTGHTYADSGNRVDALMRTKAVISQYVLIEIKKPSSALLQPKEYRSGCWTVSPELTNAIGQIQKTVFDFTNNQAAKVQLKGHDGKLTGEEVFRIQPRSFLVFGNLSTLKDHNEKFQCFQLFRNSIITPEILTYDELYERAKCIVQTISYEEESRT